MGSLGLVKVLIDPDGFINSWFSRWRLGLMISKGMLWVPITGDSNDDSVIIFVMEKVIDGF
jgi:hypothetical protein